MAVSEYVRKAFEREYGMTPRQVGDDMVVRKSSVAIIQSSAISDQRQVPYEKTISAESADILNRKILHKW